MVVPSYLLPHRQLRKTCDMQVAASIDLLPHTQLLILLSHSRAEQNIVIGSVNYDEQLDSRLRGNDDRLCFVHRPLYQSVSSVFAILLSAIAAVYAAFDFALPFSRRSESSDWLLIMMNSWIPAFAGMTVKCVHYLG
jgi:hypothetical protein